MPTYDMEGYVQHADDNIDKGLWRPRHARIVCWVVLSAGIVVVLSTAAHDRYEAQMGATSPSWITDLATMVRSRSGFHPQFGMTGQFGQQRGQHWLAPRVALQPRAPAESPGARNVRMWAEFEDYNRRISVPLEVLGGVIPEQKAAEQLQRFFTFVAVKVVLHQLEAAEGSSGATSYYHANTQWYRQNAPDNEIESQNVATRTAPTRSDYEELLHFYHTEPLKDADGWVQKLMDRNKMLAVRIMEVRKAYATNDFEWEWLQSMAVQGLKQGNEKVMKGWAENVFALEDPLHSRR